MPLPLIPAAALSLLSAIAPNLIQAAGTVVEGAARKYLLEPLGLAPEADEKSIEKAISNASPETLARIKEADLKFQVEMKRVALEFARAEIEAETEKAARINEQMGREAASGDSYVRRMRPTFGYSVSLQLNVLFFGVAYILWRTPSAEFGVVASGIAAVVSALMMIVVTELGVLGVYINGRTKEKQTETTGEAPPTLLGAIAGRIVGGLKR